MGFIVLGAVLATFYAGERISTRMRKSKDQRRRAQAEYPTTANDPTGRTVIF